jgi:hypothetical protein
LESKLGRTLWGGGTSLCKDFSWRRGAAKERAHLCVDKAATGKGAPMRKGGTLIKRRRCTLQCSRFLQEVAQISRRRAHISSSTSTWFKEFCTVN